jgi:hypothetical protein
VAPHAAVPLTSIPTPWHRAEQADQALSRSSVRDARAVLPEGLTRDATDEDTERLINWLHDFPDAFSDKAMLLMTKSIRHPAASGGV